jgi:hypothetical protein
MNGTTSTLRTPKSKMTPLLKKNQAMRRRAKRNEADLILKKFSRRNSSSKRAQK